LYFFVDALGGLGENNTFNLKGDECRLFVEHAKEIICTIDSRRDTIELLQKIVLFIECICQPMADKVSFGEKYLDDLDFKAKVRIVILVLLLFIIFIYSSIRF
jgi:hypothetical protein